MLSYLPLEDDKILKNWLNQIYLMCGLDKDRLEIKEWIKVNIEKPIRSVNKKKGLFDLEALKKEAKKYEYSLSDQELEEYQEELRNWKLKDNENDSWKIKAKLFRKKSLELWKERINVRPLSLIHLINIEANYDTYKKGFLYDERDDYWQILLSDETRNFASLHGFEEEVLKKFWEKSDEEIEKLAAKDYYWVLGVSDNASIEEIKNKYRQLSLTEHPDKLVNKSANEKKTAEEKFKKISVAYGVLGDEAKKAKYDLCLLEDKDWDADDIYFNRKGWTKFTNSEAITDNDFGKRIEFVLQKEFELNDIDEETISNYSRVWEEEEYSTFHAKADGLVQFNEELAKKAKEAYNEFSEPEKGLLKAEDFCSR
ncbi:MAG: DnaJ-like protein, partial [Mycoplasmataceae bacterium RV_VA103A]